MKLFGRTGMTALLLSLLTVCSARAGEGVSIEDVVKMHDSGWSDELVIKLVQSRGVGFATSVENLNLLREKKLSDKVLMAIIETASGRPAEPDTPAPSSGEQAEVPIAPAPTPEEPALKPDLAEKPAGEQIKPCATCRGSMLVPCPNHKPTDVLAANDMKGPPPCCLGLGWVKCPACGGRGAEGLLAEMKREMAARIVEWPKMDKAAGIQLFHAETRHFCMDTDLPPDQARKLAAHGESLLEKLRTTFGNEDMEFTRPANMRLVCIGKVDDFVKFIDWFGEYSGLKPEQRMRLAQSNGMTLYGSRGTALCVRERTGKDYTNYLVNGLGRVLIGHVYGYKGRLPAWISEGFSTFCETLELGRPGVWSFSYDPKDLDTGGDWKAVVRRAAQAGKTVPLNQLMAKNLAEMKAIDYQQSWSVNSALIYGGPDKYLAFIKAVKERQDQTEALEKAYDQKLPQIEAVWKNWAANQR